MTVQYSIQKMVSDGTLSTVVLGIQYLQRNDIYIRIAGEETPQSGAPSGYTWSFIDNTTLKILPVVPNGIEVVVYRRTDIDAMYNIYSQNAQFDEATIDENNQQLLYIAQEYLEQGIPGAGVDTIEFLRDDGSSTYYRIKRTDGSYSEEFTVPSAGSITKILAWEALRRSYAEAGYNLVAGSFEAGGTLVNANDVLLQESTGKGFTGPTGTVAVGTDPTSGGFVDRSGDVLLTMSSYARIRAYSGPATRHYCSGRTNVFDKAFGYFYADPSDTTSPDDDGVVLVRADGVRMKRQLSGDVNPEWFGAKGDGINDDTVAVRAAVAKALSLGLSAKCLGGTYLLTGTIDMYEPFDFNGGNSKFIINHSGDGFVVREVAVFASRRNVSSFKDMNFAVSSITPNSHLRIGVASLPEPTNIEIDGVHFRSTAAVTAHIINERGYGQKINNSAFQSVIGACILFKQGIESSEATYSYQCYVNQVDITGCDYGIIVEGGKIQIRDSVIESCRQRAVWSKGIGFNPSIYLDNVYLENNTYSLYFESQQASGYTLNSEVGNCFFANNSGKNFASASNTIRVVNNKGFSLNNVEGSGVWTIAGNNWPTVPYNPNKCPTSMIKLESPLSTSYDAIPAGTRKPVPMFNLQKKNNGRLNTALKVTIVRNTGNIVTYYQGILLASDPAGMTWRLIQIASQDVSGIIAAPTFEKNPSDATDMNLYFYYPQTAITIVTVEGEGGFG